MVDGSPNTPQVVVGTLLELLQDPDPQVRQDAAVALGRIGHLEATEGLVERLSDSAPTVREASAWALGTLGESVLEQAGIALTQRLDDPSPAVKQAAAQALASIGATQVGVELLIEALNRSDAETRHAALLALVGIESRAAYSSLVSVLGDQDGRVRQGAIAAIGELGERRALPLFQERLAGDPEVGVRSEAAFRLGKLGELEEIPRLRRAAEHDASPTVRRWARWALAQFTLPDEPD